MKTKSAFYITANLLYQSGRIGINESINSRAVVVDCHHQFYDYQAMKSTKSDVLHHLMNMIAKANFEGYCGLQWTNNGVRVYGRDGASCRPFSFVNNSPFA